MYTYVIDKNLSVVISNSNDAGTIFQPFDPKTGLPFKSKEEAEEYAKNRISELSPPPPTE